MPSITRSCGDCGKLTFSCWRRSKDNLNRFADWALAYCPVPYRPDITLDPRSWLSGVRVVYQWKHEKRERISPHSIKEFVNWLYEVGRVVNDPTQIIGFITRADIEVAFTNLDHIDPHDFRLLVARYKKAFKRAESTKDPHPDVAPNGIKINISRGIECSPTDFLFEASEMYQIFKEMNK